MVEESASGVPTDSELLSFLISSMREVYNPNDDSEVAWFLYPIPGQEPRTAIQDAYRKSLQEKDL